MKYTTLYLTYFLLSIAPSFAAGSDDPSYSESSDSYSTCSTRSNRSLPETTRAIPPEDVEEKISHQVRPSDHSDEDSSCHWGLKHWFMGIFEYAGRCICCGVKKRDDRTWVKEGYGSSDCCAVSLSLRECDNPCCGTLCCPLVGAIHLLCLPVAICCCSPHQMDSWDMSLEGCIRDGVEANKTPASLHQTQGAINRAKLDNSNPNPSGEERDANGLTRAQRQDITSYVDYVNGH